MEPLTASIGVMRHRLEALRWAVNSGPVLTPVLEHYFFRRKLKPLRGILTGR